MRHVILAVVMLATIVDNPDPIGLRQERCRQVRSVFDADMPCPPEGDVEVVEMFTRTDNTIAVLPWSACDNAQDCLNTITDACRRHGYGIHFVQFTPRPNKANGERECVGKCNNPGQLQVEVNCNVPQPTPRPPDEVAVPGVDLP